MKFLPLLLLLAGCASVPPSATVDLGRLADWVVIGDAEWLEEGNEIVGGGAGDGFLVSRETHQSYRLRVEFRVDDVTNSGVFVSCSDPSEITPFNCYEINIWDNHPRQEFRTGAIVAQVEPFEKLNSLDRWNTYEVAVTPERITVVLNGTEVSALNQPERQGGYVALQRAVGGEVRFRNIELELID